MDKILDLEETGWLEPAVSRPDFNWADEGIGVVENVGAKGISILEDGELESAVIDLCLLDSDISPRVILAVDKVFNFVKLSVALERSIDLEFAIVSLPDSEISVSEVLSVSTLSHMDNALPGVAFASAAEDINASAVDSITVDGSDLSAVLRSDAATVD